MARILVLTICDMCPFFDNAECFSLCGKYGLKVEINKSGDGKHPIPAWCPLPRQENFNKQEFVMAKPKVAKKKVDKAKDVDAELVDETTAIVVSNNTPGALIAQAIEKGSDLSQLQTVLDVQIKWEANEAKKAYYVAMSEFKADPPEIDKDQAVSYGQTSYRHASLANVTSKISKALSVHGLSATWKTSQADNQISVICTISHRMGYSESTTLSAAPDDSGKKNGIQAIGSTITYLERYTLLAMTGLATHENEDDGAGSEMEYITEEQENTLDSMINENAPHPDAYREQFLTFMDVESISLIPSKQFKKAEAAIKTAIREVKK